MKLNDDMLCALTEEMFNTIAYFKEINKGVTPEREDIIKCIDYALKSLCFFPLAMYIHLGILGLMKDSTPFVVYLISYAIRHYT